MPRSLATLPLAIPLDSSALSCRHMHVLSQLSFYCEEWMRREVRAHDHSCKPSDVKEAATKAQEEINKRKQHACPTLLLD
jgi:hypothetical protein